MPRQRRRRSSRDYGNEFYAAFYDTASRIDIVGIACTSFVSNLYTGYGSTQECSHRAADRNARLGRLRETRIFKNIRAENRKLRVTAYLLNPFCEYAKTRAEEEGNRHCRSDILKAIDLVGLMSRDLRRVCERSEWQIGGHLQIALIDKNPYVSIFRALHRNTAQNVIYAGFLVRGHLGSDCPKLRINYSEDADSHYQVMGSHLESLRNASHELFSWTGNEVKFKCPKVAAYDVFLCHNSKDKDAVRDIGLWLREHEGILPWLDEWNLDPGEVWVDKLEQIISQINCAAVFLGPHEKGPWEEMEIRLLVDRAAREGLRVIPVVLPGVQGEPHRQGFLNQFQAVDFRRNQSEALKKLASGIRVEL